MMPANWLVTLFALLMLPMCRLVRNALRGAHATSLLYVDACRGRRCSY